MDTGKRSLNLARARGAVHDLDQGGSPGASSEGSMERGDMLSKSLERGFGRVTSSTASYAELENSLKAEPLEKKFKLGGGAGRGEKNQ